MANIEGGNAMDIEKEKGRQRLLPYNRSEYQDYNSILAFFQAQSVIENAHGDSLLDLACGDGTITALLSFFFFNNHQDSLYSPSWGR